MFKSRVKFLALMACFSVFLLCGTLAFCLQTQNLDSNVNIQYTAPKESKFLTYELNTTQDGWVVTGFDESKRNGETALNIPAMHEENGKNLPVTEIGEKAFYLNKIFTSVVIGDNVSKIGSLAFSSCSNLSGQLVIPDGVTQIGSNAFAGCSGLSGQLVIPNSVTQIGLSAFAYCSGFTSLTIGKRVTSIDKEAFQYCTSLTEINYNAVNCQDLTNQHDIFHSAGSESSGINLNIGDDVITIPQRLTDGSENIINLKIGNHVETIGKNALNGLKIETLSIPDSVKTIGSQAFYSCKNLIDVEIGKGLNSVDRMPFDYCPNIERIVVDKANENCTSRDTSGTECNVLINKSTKTLIAGCKNSTIPRDNSVTRIEDNAFASKRMVSTDLIIPFNITTIGVNAFNGCKITSVKIGSGVTNIYSGAFANNQGLNDVIIESSTIYGKVANTSSANGSLTYYIQTGGTIKVLATADKGNNTYLNSTSYFTKSTTTIDGKSYNVYTKK